MNAATSAIVALIIPLLVTGLTLARVAYNRGGSREPIVLTEREAWLDPRSADDSRTGVRISWHPTWGDDVWLDRAKLATLGFDVSVDPSSPDAERHYGRSRPREVYVALELNGPAWQRALERAEVARQTAGIEPRLSRETLEKSGSRLVPVDAHRDAGELEARYPNGRTHLITAAVVAVRRSDPKVVPASVFGVLEGLMPGRIEVPTEFATRLPPYKPGERPATFSAEVRYGRLLEPWIVGVR